MVRHLAVSVLLTKSAFSVHDGAIGILIRRKVDGSATMNQGMGSSLDAVHCVHGNKVDLCIEAKEGTSKS